MKGAKNEEKYYFSVYDSSVHNSFCTCAGMLTLVGAFNKDLGFGDTLDSFSPFYNSNGRLAGTYTLTIVNRKDTWTKR